MRRSLESGDREIQKLVNQSQSLLLALEHPWNAWSWHLPEIVEVACADGVQMVEGHMCAYGLQAVFTSRSG